MKAEATSYQRLREHLSYLGLSTAAENLSGELDRGLKDKLSATQVLETLLEAEVVATKARRARGRLRFAHFPVHKTLTNFDFDFQPSLDRKQVAELLNVSLSTVDVKYKLVNIDKPSEFEIIASSGTGVDPQDKGVGKAMTYSLKYALMRAFLIPTGEDPAPAASRRGRPYLVK